MPDDSNPADVPPGNPSPFPATGGDKTPAAPAVGGAGESGADAGPDGPPVLGGAESGGAVRPPKPRRGPGKGNTWAWGGSEWITVRKTDAPLDDAARKAIAAAGWGRTGEAPVASPGAAVSPQPAPVPPVFAFAEDDNRRFLEYALDSAEGARMDHLKALALSILAGSKAESRADEFADRFHSLEKLSEREREGVVIVLLDFLREVEVNIPKSAYGVWALLNRGWRGFKSQKEMVKELTQLKAVAA